MRIFKVKKINEISEECNNNIKWLESKFIAYDDLKEELNVMIKLSNIEISKRIPVNPTINHWIDQYHKILKSNVKKLLDVEG